MAEQRAGRVELTAAQGPEDRGGSTPKPPKAAARSARLEPNRDPGHRQKLVAREKPRTPRNALAFWDLEVSAFASSLSATGENLAKSQPG
jgi:hypothetical protein